MNDTTEQTNDERTLKDQVRSFWDDRSCGEIYAVGTSEREYYDSYCDARYLYEPYIIDFAGFPDARVPCAD